MIVNYTRSVEVTFGIVEVTFTLLKGSFSDVKEPFRKVPMVGTNAGTGSAFGPVVSDSAEGPVPSNKVSLSCAYIRAHSVVVIFTFYPTYPAHPTPMVFLLGVG